MNPLLTIASFLTKWAASGAAERANAQSFVIDLCHLLRVEAPMPKTPDESANAYVFEKTIPGTSGVKNFIDCYKRGHFVLEAKQGADAGDGAALFSAAANDTLCYFGYDCCLWVACWPRMTDWKKECYVGLFYGSQLSAENIGKVCFLYSALIPARCTTANNTTSTPYSI